MRHCVLHKIGLMQDIFLVTLHTTWRNIKDFKGTKFLLVQMTDALAHHLQKWYIIQNSMNICQKMSLSTRQVADDIYLSRS